MTLWSLVFISSSVFKPWDLWKWTRIYVGTKICTHVNSGFTHNCKNLEPTKECLPEYGMHRNQTAVKALMRSQVLRTRVDFIYVTEERRRWKWLHTMEMYKVQKQVRREWLPKVRKGNLRERRGHPGQSKDSDDTRVDTWHYGFAPPTDCMTYSKLNSMNSWR